MLGYVLFAQTIQPTQLYLPLDHQAWTSFHFRRQHSAAPAEALLPGKESPWRDFSPPRGVSRKRPLFGGCLKWASRRWGWTSARFSPCWFFIGGGKQRTLTTRSWLWVWEQTGQKLFLYFNDKRFSIVFFFQLQVLSSFYQTQLEQINTWSIEIPNNLNGGFFKIVLELFGITRFIAKVTQRFEKYSLWVLGCMFEN